VRTYPHPDGGTFDAVAGLSFEVERGEVFALLGPNGAGKTTTLEIIEGLNVPSAGRAEVLGLDVVTHRERIKQRIGVQLQASSYFELLTLREILVLFGSFYATRRDPEELLEAVGLAEKRNARVGQLSGGQAQRFSIVAALVNDPEVVFLDEPTTGLDPQSRRNLWELIRQVNAEGRTVVLTTHYMEEAETLADRVAIVDHGRLVALDTPAGLVGALDGGYRIRFAVPHPIDEHGLASPAGRRRGGPAGERPAALRADRHRPLDRGARAVRLGGDATSSPSTRCRSPHRRSRTSSSPGPAPACAADR
jgi:ABC-2 type transport system ATP-binding protein